MEKQAMREWVGSLEEMVDNKLKKWKKIIKIENGESVQLAWQFEQAHFTVDIFWEDKKEAVHLKLNSPRTNSFFTWSGLTNRTFNLVQDKIGNLSMGIMHPAIDPEFDG